MSGVRSLVWKVALGCLSAHRSYEMVVLSRAVGAMVQRDWVAARTVRRAVSRLFSSVCSERCVGGRRGSCFSAMERGSARPGAPGKEQTIRKDCTRTFSQLLFFKSAAVQDLIVRLLLVFAFAHPEIGYKQGMTDLLAVLLLCLYCDRWRLGGGGEGEGENSLPQRTQDVLDEHLRFQSEAYRQEAEAFRRTLSPSQRHAIACLQILTSSKYLEHDCFCLLEAVFAPLRGCYVSDNSDSSLESRMDRVMWLVGRWDSALGSHLAVFP